MDFLISPAYAQAGGQAGGIMPTLIMVGLFFVFMYFMIIRPQMKRQKEHKKLLESLDKGVEVVTSGGVAGKIRQVGENFIVGKCRKAWRFASRKTPWPVSYPKARWTRCKRIFLAALACLPRQRRLCPR